MRRVRSTGLPRSVEQEEEYFRRKDAELLEQRKHEAAKQREAAEMKRAAGIDSDEVISQLRACGYNRETIPLLHLVPLIEVAWADGKISKDERAHILDAARLHGVEEGSPAQAQLVSWLNTRPDEEVFRRSLQAIRAIVHALDPEHRQARASDLLALCTRVAAASGGFFGRKVSLEEKQMLAQITAELDVNHHEASVRMAERMR